MMILLVNDDNFFSVNDDNFLSMNNNNSFSINNDDSFSINDNDSLSINNNNLLHYYFNSFFVIKHRVKIIVNVYIIVCLSNYNIFTLEKQYIQ